MVIKCLTVANPMGLHLRPSGLLAREAAAYQSKVYIRYNGRKITAKSVMKLMAAGIKSGDKIELLCDGIDEEAAAEAVARLIEGKLD